MLGRLVDVIAPDYCYGCGLIGTILCQSCFYDIVTEPFGRCLSCSRPVGVNGRCGNCRPAFQRGWAVGWRQGVLEKLVDATKFDSVRRGCQVQAQLLDACLPELPNDTVVVPIPTTRPHIRQRGFGHAEQIAKQLAQIRKLPYRSILQRQQHSVQYGASRQARLAQAKQAYSVSDQLAADSVYLLIDDVYTTGATAKYASKQLKAAGAKQVWLAVTSCQPLD